MTGALVVNSGLEWLSDKAFDNVTDIIDEVAVGTGTTDPARNDTSLENEVYRGTSGGNIEFNEIDNTGGVEAKIVITGGTEVPDGTEVSEFGIYTEEAGTNTLILREVREPITINNGNKEEFTIPLTFTQA